MTKLVYDTRDDKLFEQRGMKNLYWLDDLGAIPLSELRPGDDSFLFAGARSIEDYEKLTAGFNRLRDSVSERLPLLNLDTVLKQIEQNCETLPRPKTWTWRLDEPIPKDLEYPLFVRTAKSSWKLGGKISKVCNNKQLEAEAFELRRAFGFDQPILAREWLNIVTAGKTAYGPVPLEIRTWIVDSVPFAWSFHHLQFGGNSELFPLARNDIDRLFDIASQVNCFESRLVCADFVKTTDGSWVFLEAGPGSCAGTAHEFVYKSVASRLADKTYRDEACLPDKFGQLF